MWATRRRLWGVALLPAFLLWGSASAFAVGGAPLDLPSGPVVLDATLDASYKLIVENTHGAPDVGGSGQVAASDLVAESSANHVWFDFGDANNLSQNDGLFVRGSGTADIQNVFMTWDLDYVYIAIVGPNAFDEDHGCCGDDMDLFVAIDTADSGLTPTTPTLDRTAVPGNKAVDFAGWAPNYFVMVDATGPTWHAARLYTGTTEVAADTDPTTTDATFDVTSDWTSSVTEIRIAWSALGGKPADLTGAPWNMAVYTTYDGDDYDTYDTAPGYGQGSVFEQLGDVPCDSDHCSVVDGGDDEVDPVTGVLDACDCVNENDGGLGAGIAPSLFEQPGSDNTFGKDIDTIQGYFRIDNVGQIPDCDDTNGCTDDSWNPTDGCVNAPNTDPCDDGSACTSDDVCSGGGCGGTDIVCDDGDVCTDDGCDPGTGCTVVNNTAQCDDGDACTDGDACLAGSCVPGPALDVDDGNVCTDDTCDSSLGAVNTPNTGICDDGDPCTTGESCLDGSCQGGTAPDCNDGNPCTTDSCDATGTGCVNANNTATCDDGDACTDADTCANGLCVPGDPVACDDDNICTDDSCDSVTGCAFTPNIAGCDDGDPCTQDDRCDSGGCAGSTIGCDDGQDCTIDTCDESGDCTSTVDWDLCGDIDSDGDGLSDAWELEYGMNPNDPDSDGDGIPDGIEGADEGDGEPPDEDGDDDYDANDTDADGDGVGDAEEAGDIATSLAPADTDGDGDADYVDTDSDNDGILDGDDNCRLVANPGQEDTDGNDVGDACEGDKDGDGVLDEDDNCPSTVNPDQSDIDGDDAGDVCDADADGDGVFGTDDLCPLEDGMGEPDGCPPPQPDAGPEPAPELPAPDTVGAEILQPDVGTDIPPSQDGCDCQSGNDGVPADAMIYGLLLLGILLRRRS